jgi:Bacterial membrane protein YfhO
MSGFGHVLPPEIATVYRLPDTRLGTPSRPQGYDSLVASLFAGDGLMPVHDLLGVRYLLTPPDVDLDAPLVLRFADSTGRVYERPHPLPRLFLPRAARAFRGDSWPAEVAATPDFLASSLVLPYPGHDEDWSAGEEGPAAVTVSTLAATHLAAHAILAEERLLATSVFQDDGWRVLVDGEPRRAVVANGPLLAAWLPAGDHRVDLLYRPGPFVAGVLLAAAALAAAAGWLGSPPPSARRAAR